jgi:hypothetical protein
MATTNDLNTTLPITVDPTLPRAATNTTPTAATTGSTFDIGSLSDSDLMSLASLLGIDSSQFGGGGTGGGGATGNPDIFQIDPMVADAVSRVYQSQRQLGSDELHRKAVESAGARGLNFSDTPVSDPYMRGQALLESQLRGNEAASLLGIGQDYGKQRDTMLTNLYNVNAGLQQNRNNNLMSLFNTGSTIGMNLAGSRLSNPSQIIGQQGGVNGGGLSGIGAGLTGLASNTGVGNWICGLFSGNGDTPWSNPGGLVYGPQQQNGNLFSGGGGGASNNWWDAAGNLFNL